LSLIVTGRERQARRQLTSDGPTPWLGKDCRWASTSRATSRIGPRRRASARALLAPSSLARAGPGSAAKNVRKACSVRSAWVPRKRLKSDGLRKSRRPAKPLGRRDYSQRPRCYSVWVLRTAEQSA